MKAFVTWALGRRYRLVLLAGVFVFVFPLASTALLVLETLKRGAVSAAVVASLGMLAVAAVDMAVSGGPSIATILGALSFVLGVLMGLLLRRTQALALAFQGTVLASMVLAMLATLLVPDPESLVGFVRQALVESAQTWGAGAEQLDLIRSWDAVLLLGSVIALVMMFLVGALMLGAWWFSLTTDSVSFGREFRGLGLGRLLGLVSMGLLALSLATNVPLVENLAAIAMSAFLFQGLAVMHAWAYAKKWHWGVLLAAYVSLLIMPINVLTVFALCATGLIDNIFALRAPLGRQA